jgi:metallo-beta-lactamase family protein
VAGERETRIHGEYVPVRAAVHHLQGFSAHADRPELLQWLRGMRGEPPNRTFIVHGEPEAADGLRQAIERELGWRHVRVPQHGETVAL